MTYLHRISPLAISAFFLCVVILAHTQATAAPRDKEEAHLSQTAAGPFDVKITPQSLAEQSADPTLGRNSIEKHYHGDLEASGKGEMLTASTGTKGSAVYVAVERVTGTLRGRKGSFSLYHSGVMTRGTPELKITIVPDSGTDQLAGIAGTMSVKIDNGKHSYQLNYTLSESP